MRYLAAIAYVLLFALQLWLSSRQNSLRLGQLQASGQPRRYFVPALVSGAMIFNVYLQYFVLTGHFPVVLIIASAVVSILIQISLYLISAMLGLDSEEQRRKIESVTLIQSFTLGRTSKILMPCMIILMVLMVFWPVFVLWKYFSVYPSPAEKEVQIAIFLLCIPSLVTLIYLSGVSWRITASRYIDDDVRNYVFLIILSLCINATIVMAYPAFLISLGHGDLYKSREVWILLSSPVIILMIGGLLPFVVGTFRYRVERSNQMRWRLNWISSMLRALKLPLSADVESERSSLLSTLAKEIESRFSQNELFSVLEADFHAGRERQPDPTEVSVLAYQKEISVFTPQQPALGVPGGAVAIPGGMPTPATFSVREKIIRARGALGRKSSIPQLGKSNALETVRNLVQSEREHLVKWDISFSQINELLDLLQWSSNQQAAIQYLEDKKAQLNQESKEASGSKAKNLLFGVLKSVLGAGVSALVVWAFKTYEPSIIAFIGSLAQIYGA